MTARSILAIQPAASIVEWFDAKTPGLSLMVTPNGTRTWYLLYRSANTARRVKIGRWSPKLGLAEARSQAQKLRYRIDTKGADPAHERKAAREACTIGDLADLYMTQYAKLKKTTWKDDNWRINRYILPAWRTRAVTTITRLDVHDLLDPVAKDKPVQAHRVQMMISKLFNFAIDREHALMNPCHRMAKRTLEQPREVVLTDEKLRALWTALDAAPTVATDAVLVRLLTGQRGGEVHRMRWADLERAPAGWVWTIPARDAKNGRAHRVPLSRAVEAVLARRHDARQVGDDRVFPGLYHQRNDLRDLATIHKGAYRWHDLRRTVASRLAGLGIHEEVIARLLNHAKRGITATVYNQHGYDAEKLAALEAWAAELSRIVKGPAATSAVLTFRREGAL